MLAEYAYVRHELQSRSSSQATILSLNVTGIAAVAGFFFSQNADIRILFVIPVVSSLLGFLYLDHAINIGRLGRFIRWVIKPKLAQALHVAQLVDYEVHSNNYHEPKLARRLLLPCATLSMFGVVPAVALIIPVLSLISGASSAGATSFQLGGCDLGIGAGFAAGTSSQPGGVDPTFWIPGLLSLALLVIFIFVYLESVFSGKLEASYRPSEPIEVKATDIRA